MGRFFPPLRLQKDGHCGPTSLSMCLGILGVNAGPGVLVRKAGKSKQEVFDDGIDEFDLKRAAAAFKVRGMEVRELDHSRGESFVRRLDRHLKRNLPAILLVLDANHWIAIIGRIGGRYVVYDPDDDERDYGTWTRRELIEAAWNEPDTDETGEPDQYYTLLFSRRDGRPARWKPTREWLDLTAAGSAQSADEMASDLRIMAGRASGEGSRLQPMGTALESVKDQVVGALLHWLNLKRTACGPRHIRELFDDYVVIADAAGITVRGRCDRSSLVADMTCLLATYAWTGRL